MSGLIDTTEMYLKIIYEMMEDGCVPLRARIVERLDHSGPTVSQTVARMERDGLVIVARDRRIELTDKGYEIAVDVVRKHRLAERLLVDVVGVNWTKAHEEACRWEHVMSDDVEEKLNTVLNAPAFDPYGNKIPVPGDPIQGQGHSAISMVDRYGEIVASEVVRIGEPVQAQESVLEYFSEAGLLPGATVNLTPHGNDVLVTGVERQRSVLLTPYLAQHLFVADVVE